MSRQKSCILRRNNVIGENLAITVSVKFHQIPSISIFQFDTVVESMHPQPYDVVKR